MSKTINKLIINNPYKEPEKYWLYNREENSFDLRDGRRKSGYWKESEKKLDKNDPGEFVEIELVNRIRPRVKKWRENNYPNVTPTTKKLLNFWRNSKEREQDQNPFFCQLEAIETAIWLVESVDADKQGIVIPSDGEWKRECFKLATGTGKTVVMSMLITWHVLNKIANPRDSRFSKNILIITPGITVKDRLSVLLPTKEDNFYQVFRIVDNEMWKKLLQAKILITNWHNLSEKSDDNKKNVIKRGTESNEAFCKRVLKDFGDAKNILVINDEAHHCWRLNDIKYNNENDDEKATIWVSGLDKIDNARKILKAYDLSATPFRPSGTGKQSEKLFPWIVSDFGLNDSIESGLVKTPRVAVRDDTTVDDDLKSKFFNIYFHVKDDLNRKVDAKTGLPDLVKSAIDHLGSDWLNIKEQWKSVNRQTPPVFIAVTNRKETAARLSYHILNGFSSIQELEDESKFLRIDQEALEKLEAELITNDKLQELEREKFNTVGKVGKLGEKIQCVVGVNMLSEGWDARTVTNILGLRAFTSQLLCEQVIGRGLRRVSYELNDHGMFDPEYVTVFGIPFSFLPIEGDGKPKEPEKPKVLIEAVEKRKNLEITFPNVLRVNKQINTFIDLDLNKISSLEISLKDCPSIVEIAPTIDNQPRFDQIHQIDIDRLAETNRFEATKMQASVRIHEGFGNSWKGDPASHIFQLGKIFDKFINSEKLVINLPKNSDKEKLKRIILSQKIQTISEHIKQFIIETSNSELLPIIDESKPWIRTGDLRPWMTSKKTQRIEFSHINNMVVDSNFEGLFCQELERLGKNKKIHSWVKNDHIDFKVWYVFKGEVHAYYPDFIIKINEKKYLIIETKGNKKDQDEYKWNALKEWCIAVNNQIKFGNWEFKQLYNLEDFKKLNL
jgi:type III restriction enzyme